MCVCAEDPKVAIGVANTVNLISDSFDDDGMSFSIRIIVIMIMIMIIIMTMMMTMKKKPARIMAINDETQTSMASLKMKNAINTRSTPLMSPHSTSALPYLVCPQITSFDTSIMHANPPECEAVVWRV